MASSSGNRGLGIVLHLTLHCNGEENPIISLASTAMETPSSARRVTRSQTSASSQKSKQLEDPQSRSRKNGGANADRAPLLDITNDSPIVGLAAVEKTPSSSSSSLKNRVRVRRTPGSGEAILRGQVKTLLQKVVEEEGDFANKPSSILQIPRFPTLVGISRSPAQLLAPTPANTPQVMSVSTFQEEGPTVTISLQVVPSRNQEEPQECLLNRALLFDSPSKSGASEDSAISSSLTFQGSESSSSGGGGGGCTEKSPTEDDSSSLWSIQVNASAHEEDYEDGAEELFEGYGEEEDEAYFDEDEEEGEDPFADLCEGMRKMSVVDEAVRLPEFKGKHTRFVYNSDDEIEGEEEAVKGEETAVAISPGVLVLKGLPAPEGKHLRFHEEDAEA